MRIALVRYHDKGNINTRLPSSLNRVRGVLPPLGLAYLASYLRKKGHDVKIIDAMAENLTISEFRQKIHKFSPGLVGITTMTSTFFGSLEAAKIAKETGAKVVMGGAHLSAYPEETLMYDYVDFGIMGDGEIPLQELAKALEEKKSYRHIQGLVFKENGKIINNGHFILRDLNILPMPAYDLLPLDKYTSIISSKHMTTMITARGCPYQCGYCFSRPQDKIYRTIAPTSVVDQIEILIKKHKIKELMFYDDTIALKRDHIEQICYEIIRRNLKIRWESPCRVDNVDYELLALMAESGCFRLRFGVESGNEKILKLMNKNITLEQAKNAFLWCNKLGIETFVYFMIGYINETPETIKDTINFAIELNPDFVMFTVATPYPFTELFDLAIRNGLVEKDYWRNFVRGEETKRIPFLVKNSDYWVRKAYKEYYLRPSFVLKKISQIRKIQDIKHIFDAAKGILCFRT
jgi:radical SAM superfamily enzyme YgiQ (UPF0313 family)